MDNTINNHGNGYNENKIKKINNIPLYTQQLFEHYCKSLKQFGIWINKEEFSKLNEDIRKYLSEGDDSGDNFINWLKKMYNVKIKYPKTLSYVVQNHNDDNENEKELDAFWNGKSVILPLITYNVPHPVPR